MNLPTHSDVIIIGAGASGLMMAAQLLRSGIHPVILDCKTSAVNQNPTNVIQPQSLEMLEQLGLAERFLEVGNRVNAVALNDGTTEVDKLNPIEHETDENRHSFAIVLPQKEIERIFLDFLTANACPVFWNAELLELSQTEDHVFLKIEREEVTSYLRCDWLIGADGAKSTVRERLRIPVRSQPELEYYSAELSVARGFTSDVIRYFVKDKNLTCLYPIGNNKARFLGKLPTQLHEKSDLKFEDIEQHLSSTLGFPLDVESSCFEIFSAQPGVAAHFRENRCFLVGEAGHTLSPIFGRALNSALADAYNLAWKLVGVIRKDYTPAILNSYEAERFPASVEDLKSDNNLSKLLSGSNRLKEKIKDWLGRIGFKKPGRPKLLSVLTPPNTDFRSSTLSVHHSLGKRIKAGDRLPYIQFYDEKQNTETDLHSWCAKVGFTLIILGNLNSRNLLAVAKWIKLNYPANLNFYYLPHSKRNRHVFDYFEIKENRRKAVLVRPDLYIGYMNDVVDIELIEGYMKEISGH